MLFQIYLSLNLIGGLNKQLPRTPPHFPYNFSKVLDFGKDCLWFTTYDYGSFEIILRNPGSIENSHSEGKFI